MNAIKRAIKGLERWLDSWSKSQAAVLFVIMCALIALYVILNSRLP